MSHNPLEPIPEIVYAIEHIDFDLAQIKREVSQLIVKGYPEQRGFCVTNSHKVALDNWLHYNAQGVTEWTDNSTGRSLADSEFYQKDWVWSSCTGWHDHGLHRDQDLIDWNDDIPTPEIKRLTQSLEARYGQRMRCRMSTMKGPYNLGSHCDPHTPWRIHLNLLSGPLTVWEFDSRYRWNQPSGNLWLIRTGNVTHTVKLAPEETRVQLFWHLWEPDLGPQYYQFPR